MRGLILSGSGGPLSSIGGSSVNTITTEEPYLTIHSEPTIATSSRCKKCPAGRYGATMGLETSDCSGVCEEGYWCKEGSVSPFSDACNEPNTHCPRGTSERRLTVDGYISVPNGTTHVDSSLASKSY